MDVDAGFRGTGDGSVRKAEGGACGVRVAGLRLERRGGVGEWAYCLAHWGWIGKLITQYWYSRGGGALERVTCNCEKMVHCCDASYASVPAWGAKS